MRDLKPPFLESTVTFRIASSATGGTVIHALEDTRFERMMMTATNNNSASVIRAI